MDDPFALELYRMFQSGFSPIALSKRFEIPVDRIEQRLKAAATYMEAKSGSRAEATGRVMDCTDPVPAKKRDSVLRE